MKTSIALLASAATLSAGIAQAHFQLVYTPETMLEKPAEIGLKLVFGHPMENGHTMDMGEPVEFFVQFKDKRTDLKDSLKPITWKGAHNEANAYETTYKVRRNGDYVFALTPAPYYEGSEDIYIQQITKSYVNKGAMPTTWNEPLGLPTEIVPLNKPYQVFVGSTFSGQLLSEGKPAPGVECEIEYINTDIDMKANAFSEDANGEVPATGIVAITDANGVFTFGIPTPGVWGFACLGSGPVKEHEGKELSQDAVIWINASTLGASAESGSAPVAAVEPDDAERFDKALSAQQRRSVQKALREIGLYDSSIDGDFGPQTREALKIVQRARGLSDTGLVDGTLFETLVSLSNQ
ncbi:DUF4198 domain-containing protein [Imhoffiella purpurea]|uniref:Additional periplasmic component NikK of nickel ECF transporter n=1 Tax=Imhoffiella purpurea TaxID=1249627 RepID=W9VUX5_9GAMM|nr:DUF4198 domain-containing protein [Imhoffiella purpurea]EXJ14195.1 Additional periplasmic component NikK of nickel ECF transporter [Imhoffiella purpurea]